VYHGTLTGGCLERAPSCSCITENCIKFCPHLLEQSHVTATLDRIEAKHREGKAELFKKTPKLEVSIATAGAATRQILRLSSPLCPTEESHSSIPCSVPSVFLVVTRRNCWLLKEPETLTPEEHKRRSNSPHILRLTDDPMCVCVRWCVCMLIALFVATALKCSRTIWTKARRASVPRSSPQTKTPASTLPGSEWRKTMASFHSM
jgi:hypothetical protein